MTRSKSPSDTDCSSIDTPYSLLTTSTEDNSETTVSTSPKSPRNPANRVWIQEQQKRVFLHHLTQWALSHDSSLHFHGKISLPSQSTRHAGYLELGKPVKCVLGDSTFTDARQIIVIKLFPPPEHATVEELVDDHTRRDSMELIDPAPESRDFVLRRRNRIGGLRQDMDGNSRYRLVVRCGAGWMSARDYFSKLYISRLGSTRAGWAQHDERLRYRSRALGPAGTEAESVTIRPLFHTFMKLPPELQEMVLMTAAGLRRSYDLRSDDYGTMEQTRKNSAAISISTLFRISKRMTEHLQPYVYHRTDFHFGLTGFTNFLWQSGPENRREIRRLTFHFGKLALLHCIRWLAPDPVFLLMEPPVATNPRSLQYFWRCQIQDLVKDLHLFTLTINIKHISETELPMMVSIMQSAFGSIERLQFVETDNQGTTKLLELDDERLSDLGKKLTWRQMCLNYYQAHRGHSYFFKFELLKGQAEDLETIMAEESKFYDTPFPPLARRKEQPALLD